MVKTATHYRGRKMKCKNCDGSGYTESPNYPGKVECLYCDGKGVVEPLTEQEYIQTCTTEQLAEIVLHLAWDTNEIFKMIYELLPL